MQNADTSQGSPAALPKMGPNKIQQALEDYDRMVSELDALKKTHAEYVDIANQLRAENDAIKRSMKVQTEFLTRQIDMITSHRDRLATTLKGLMTRYKVIREVFTQCETEALAEGLALNETEASSGDGAGAVEKAALRDLALHDPRRRT